ncbi:MAG: PH domain-containing protein [Candidatus Saccharimonadales bacterium]
MISRSTLDKQLKLIHFNGHSWGRSEVQELCNVLTPDEEIDECVNGYYEAGFALLVATKDRLLLIDKKPLNYVTVQDMRFDMINEFDYNHRLIGAEISICAGSKTLHFRSFNKIRLRRLINFVQYSMTEVKRLSQSYQEAQKSHLERMNQQLQTFLAIQQYQQQQQQLLQQQSLYQSQPALPPQMATLPQLTDMPKSNDLQTQVDSKIVSTAQLGIAAMKRVVPNVSAYTKLPLMHQSGRYQKPSVPQITPTPPTYPTY